MLWDYIDGRASQSGVKHQVKFAHAVLWVEWNEEDATFTLTAEDIGVQAHTMGATSVTMSYRSKLQGFAWPEGMEELPVIDRFEGSVVHFSDGSVREFDAVILCTGYLHHYPFLPDELSIDSDNNLYPAGLYRGTVWQKNPQLFYLGAQDQWVTFTMFDAQAWYVRDLIEATDYPMFDLDEVVRIFLAWKKDKKTDILTYRDQPHRSVMTGTMATVHHTPWLAELDDSRERYLSSPDDAAGKARAEDEAPVSVRD